MIRKLITILAVIALPLTLAATASAAPAPGAHQAPSSATGNCAGGTGWLSPLIDNDGANFYGYVHDTGHDNIADTTAASGNTTKMCFAYVNSTWFEVQNQNDFLCIGADSSKYVVWVSCPRGTSSELWRWGGGTGNALINEHFNLGLTAANLQSGAPLFVADGGATAENTWFAQY